MKIGQLLDEIRTKNLVLPEFQREYVWTREQAKQLMVSLVKDYPVGSLLFWKTDNPPDLKNLDKLPEKLGAVQIILDGQQRLTTLYMLLSGEIPPYYTERDIITDPRDLYFHLEDGDFQYYQPSRMKGNLLWWRVVDCFNSTEIYIFEIAKQQSQSDQDAFKLAQRYNDHLTRLRQIREKDLPEQIVPVRATIDEAIDIFDRVNSQGTKLTDAELALTHVTGKWPQARRGMKSKIDELSKRNFHFNLTFMIRALTGVVVRRALFHTIHDRSRSELEPGWAQLGKILDYMVTMLPQHAFIHATDDLNTSNVLVPLVVYLSLHGGKFPNEKEIKRAIHWLYAALMWSRYTAQTDQRLEFDVSLVVREPQPWEALCNQIIDQRGRIEVKADDLEGRWVQHPLYRMLLVLAKAHGAVDWFNGAPLSAPHGRAYRVHNHHIFPQAVLYDSGYDPDNHLHRKVVNEIANLAFLTAESNLYLSDALPEDYLPKVEESYPGALVKQFIPMDPALWRVERFPDFLEARRQTIALKINEFMRALIKEPSVVRERSISDLISLGESATLEFKSTMQWDVVQNRVNKDLRLSVLKTITAFLNSAGGTLIIGVEDDGNVYGLDNDISTTNNSRDRFLQLLSSLVVDRVGAEYGPFVKSRLETVEGKIVCVVNVDKAPIPAFMTGLQGSREFYVRAGNTSRALDPEETVRYIEMNWE